MGNHWQLFSLTKISCSRPLDSLVDAAMSQLCSGHAHPGLAGADPCSNLHGKGPGFADPWLSTKTGGGGRGGGRGGSKYKN